MQAQNGYTSEYMRVCILGGMYHSKKRTLICFARGPKRKKAAVPRTQKSATPMNLLEHSPEGQRESLCEGRGSR